MKFVATLVVASSILFASLIFASNPEENENAEKESYIYESKFMTRIDHSKPSNQNLTEFVSFYHFSNDLPNEFEPTGYFKFCINAP